MVAALATFGVASASAFEFNVDENTPSCKGVVEVNAGTGGTMLSVKAQDMVFAYSFIDKEDHIQEGLITNLKRDNDSIINLYANTQSFPIDEVYTFVARENDQLCRSFFSVGRGLFDVDSSEEDGGLIESVYATQNSSRIVLQKPIFGKVTVMVFHVNGYGRTLKSFSTELNGEKEIVFENNEPLSIDNYYDFVVAGPNRTDSFKLMVK